ncbi:MAG TPA: GNAT family N-acetyltransferase [Oculatellaceae cyanobacterium]
MEESLIHRLRRIEQINTKVTAQFSDVIAVGPFQAQIDPSCDITWLNYAVPVAPLGTKAEVAEVLVELREVFTERDRTLRFEFTESLWPTLPEVLQEAGLQLEVSHPMMLCTPADFQPYQATTVQVKRLTEADDTKTLATYLSVRNQGFDQDFADEPPTEKEIAELREQLETGQSRCALAHLDGIPAGVGVTMPMSGICELVGVATLPALRRRGVAATLCTFLVKDHFQGGGELVWLSAGDAIAQATYERIGFHLVDSRLNYIDQNKDESWELIASHF